MPITFEDVTSSNIDEDITLPASINANDFLIVQAGYGSTPTTPSGWTLLGTQSAAFGDADQAVYYRVADGSEDGSTVTITESSGATLKTQRVCLQYRGVDTGSPIEDWASDWGSGGGSTIDGPAISRSADSSVVVALLCVWSGAYPAAGTVTAELSDTSEMMTTRHQGSSSSSNGLFAADSLTGTPSSGSGGLVVGYMTLTAATAGSSGSALGEGPIDWTPDPDTRRTFFTLSLKAA